MGEVAPMGGGTDGTWAGELGSVGGGTLTSCGRESWPQLGPYRCATSLPRLSHCGPGQVSLTQPKVGDLGSG